MTAPTGMRGMTTGMGDPGKRKARLEKRQARQQQKVEAANSRMAARAAERRMKEGKDKPQECTKDGGCSAYDSQMNPTESTGKMLKDTKLVKGVKKVVKGIGEALQPKAPRLRGTSSGAKRRYAKRVHNYYEKIKKRENRQNQRDADRTARQETRMEKRDMKAVERGQKKIARVQKKIEKVSSRPQGGLFKRMRPKKSKGSF